jgi:hypothetical protein
MAHDAIHCTGSLGNLLITPIGMVESGQQNPGTFGLCLRRLVGAHELAQLLFFFGC